MKTFVCTRCFTGTVAETEEEARKSLRVQCWKTDSDGIKNYTTLGHIFLEGLAAERKPLLYTVSRCCQAPIEKAPVSEDSTVTVCSECRSAVMMPDESVDVEIVATADVRRASPGTHDGKKLLDELSYLKLKAMRYAGEPGAMRRLLVGIVHAMNRQELAQLGAGGNNLRGAIERARDWLEAHPGPS